MPAPSLRSQSGAPRAARLALRVLAGGLVVAVVVPTVANAVGASLPNPVAVAWQATSRTAGELFGVSSNEGDTGRPASATSALPSRSAAEHAAVVAAVAKCAPRGGDPLELVVGDVLRTHGAFTTAAARGQTLVTPFGSFDLSSAAGADALCDALDAARAALPSAEKPRTRPSPHARPSPHRGSGSDDRRSDDRRDRNRDRGNGTQSTGPGQRIREIVGP
ncbi:MAG: hypothetical protein ABR520_02740 [Mycobacteriales bacterium]|nr:hypothetical protein [Frankia sp.]